MDSINSGILNYSSGAPKGSLSNPYTQSEYEGLLASGAWTGGYVEGLGYCLAEVTVPPSGTSQSSDFNNYSSYSSDSGGFPRGINSGRILNVDAAINYLIEHATPYYIKEQNGHCARNVGLALEAGGLLTLGRPTSACGLQSILTYNRLSYYPL